MQLRQGCDTLCVIDTMTSLRCITNQDKTSMACSLLLLTCLCQFKIQVEDVGIITEIKALLPHIP